MSSGLGKRQLFWLERLSQVNYEVLPAAVSRTLKKRGLVQSVGSTWHRNRTVEVVAITEAGREALRG
jgi:hypothetical protein